MDNITYWDAVGSAWNRMKMILFQPFNIEKWFLMGFAAWIAGLNSSGGGNGFNYSGSGSNDSCSGNTGNCGSEFNDFWAEYGVFIIMIAVIVIVIVLAIGIAFAWLHARGKFIFLDNVLHNRAAIVEPWKKYRKQGNSLFFWNLAIGFIGLLFILATAGVCIPMVFPLFAGKGPAGLAIPGIVLGTTLVLVYTVVISYIQMFVYDFVMPIMLKYDLRIRAAWSRFNEILKPAFGKFVIYGLVRFLLSIMISIVVLAAGLVTCCCLFFITAIPYLGTVLLLPIYVFIRLIGIEFMKQFGEDIDTVMENADEELPALP